jgi:hypothetical protein
MCLALVALNSHLDYPLIVAANRNVSGRLGMTWLATFAVPGDLGSRTTVKHGIDTFLKASSGKVLYLDVGTRIQNPDDEYIVGERWDIWFSTEPNPFSKVCTALGLEPL